MTKPCSQGWPCTPVASSTRHNVCYCEDLPAGLARDQGSSQHPHPVRRRCPVDARKRSGWSGGLRPGGNLAEPPPRPGHGSRHQRGSRHRHAGDNWSLAGRRLSGSGRAAAVRSRSDEATSRSAV